MRALLTVLILCVVFIGCKKDKKPVEQISAVSGKLYGVPFNAKVIIEKYNSFFRMPKYTQDQLFSIYISPDADKSCESSVQSFLIRLSVPKKVGRFSQDDVYVLITDPRDVTGQSGSLFNSENTIIEVTSITSDKIIGKVDIKGLDADTEFKGSFEAAICK
ncbi:hypothetical protein [Pedobacter sp. UYP1]|uniref:hypothetical protein n=1 Tax=Pedobacter sp. UYP1 TaxID=1756396 RepID=UPI00339A4642